MGRPLLDRVFAITLPPDMRFQLCCSQSAPNQRVQPYRIVAYRCPVSVGATEAAAAVEVAAAAVAAVGAGVGLEVPVFQLLAALNS